MIPKKKPADPRRQYRDVRKYLVSLVCVCEEVLRHLDAEMKKPSTVERGKRIAKICNHLELHKDLAKRFGLGVAK